MMPKTKTITPFADYSVFYHPESKPSENHIWECENQQL